MEVAKIIIQSLFLIVFFGAGYIFGLKRGAMHAFNSVSKILNEIKEMFENDVKKPG